MTRQKHTVAACAIDIYCIDIYSLYTYVYGLCCTQTISKSRLSFQKATAFLRACKSESSNSALSVKPTMFSPAMA